MLNTVGELVTSETTGELVSDLTQSATTVAEKSDPGTLFVCLMGMGVVFVGLICLVAICKIMSVILQKTAPAKSDEVESAPAAAQAVPSPAVVEPIQNRQEMMAAIAAAIAEENGTDVSGIRILSVKKI